MNGAPHASANTILEQLWRRLQLGIEDKIAEHVENQLGGLVKGGLLNAGMLYGSIPSRETVKNSTGGALVKAQAVYASGDSSGVTTVAKARANADATMPALGLLGEDIANGAQGVMIKVGRLQDFDTSAWAVGTQLYVSSATAGALTSTAPSSRAQLVAVVIIQHATTGAVEVIAGATSKTIDHAHSAAGDGGASLSPTALAMNANKITGVADPTLAQDAATKAYVDSLALGLSWKRAVRAATAVAGTLASSFENGDAIDGVTLATGDRILIKNQVAGAENGIYTVNASGAPTRATDADTGTEILQAAMFVEEGTAGADTLWVLTTNAPITIGSTSLTFAQFTASGLIDHAHTATGDGGPDVKVGGILALQGDIAPTQISANTNDYNPTGLSGATVLRLDVSGTRNLTGIAGGQDGRVLILEANYGGVNVLILKNGDTNSSAGNRIITPSAQDFQLRPSCAVVLKYDSAADSGNGAWWVLADLAQVHGHTSDSVGGQLTDSAIASGAEIDVAKLADGAALQVIRTATNGTDVEWGPAPLVKLAETIVTGSVAASIDFSSIPTTYRHLLVVMQGRLDDTTAVARTVNLRFNNDSAANYDIQVLQGVAGAAAAAEVLGQTFVHAGIFATDAAGVTAGYAGSAAVFIPNYADTTFSKQAIPQMANHTGNTTGLLLASVRGGFWRTTATAINRLTFIPGVGNFKIGTVITVYGLPI